jgi:hypothetical protein
LDEEGQPITKLTENKDYGALEPLDANVRLEQYSNIFTNLINYQTITTVYPITTMIIANDSSKALVISKASEFESYIKQYSLKDYTVTFNEKLGGDKSKDFIKCKEIEQNNVGTKYACVYCNNGVFKMRTFGKEKRSEKEI